MFYDLLTREFGKKRLFLKRNLSIPSFNPSYKKLSFEQVALKSGGFSKQPIFKESTSRDEINKFNHRDFSLDSILAVGAYDLLKPSYAPDISPLSIAEGVENSLNNLIEDHKQ